MAKWWRSLLSARADSASRVLDEIRTLRAGFVLRDDESLKWVAKSVRRLPEMVALTAVVASRVLGLEMFDAQLEGALALAHGRVVEMQTGEGKTLAAVPAVAWYARAGGGVHVLTVNDYLARRDAEWMGEIYRWLGFSVGAVSQEQSLDERRTAYRRDITYASANEVGFDYLRDGLARYAHEQVLRPFAVAVIDEADSVLLDEARIPLVIAGGRVDPSAAAVDADRVVRHLRPQLHFAIEQMAHNVVLTPQGVSEVERLLGGSNLYDAGNLSVLTAVQDALHAHTLLHRDVDYLVQDSSVVSIDELKGRVVRDRRWPAGLQTALELKERVTRHRQGRVLGSITMENLIALYPLTCGMTGTASAQSAEFRELYDLEVEAIAPHRPVIRHDLADRGFATRAEKEEAVLEEIRARHRARQPVLVGTSSVQESERLSARLRDVPHSVLNARNEAAEAAIIARAGEAGAVTISTNMAGRGVDIRLGDTVAKLGGLHVIGTNRHESSRIDRQLRGRAGRQGDPGSSQFFVSRQDPLCVKYGEPARTPGLSDPRRLESLRPRRPRRAGPGTDDPVVSCGHFQRVAEGQSLECRLFLRKYESVVEGQRQRIAERRQRLLDGTIRSDSELNRIVALDTLDELWSDYLAVVSELRASTIWVSLAGGNPFREYLRTAHSMFQELTRTIDEETAVRIEHAKTHGIEPRERGATWTYLTTDEPFGTMTQRVMRQIAMMLFVLQR
jgi:preprotein translocase subunit SecA